MNESDHLMEPEEIQFLHQIKKELYLETEHDAIPLVVSVLQSFRQTLTLKNATVLLNQLPDFLKIVFASNWRQNECQVHVEHLDEFVNLVMERDRNDGKHLFKSELQTLKVIILTLQKLYKLVDLESFEGVNYTFRRELKDASTEVVTV